MKKLFPKKTTSADQDAKVKAIEAERDNLRKQLVEIQAERDGLKKELTEAKLATTTCQEGTKHDKAEIETLKAEI